MNEEIEKIFNGFLKVKNKNIPVYYAYFVEYGDPEAFITYIEAEEEPFFSTDDDIDETQIRLDFSVYSKKSNRKIIEELKNKLKQNNYQWIGNSSDLYEPDTKYHHKVVSFYKIKEERI